VIPIPEAGKLADVLEPSKYLQYWIPDQTPCTSNAVAVVAAHKKTPSAAMIVPFMARPFSLRVCAS
jgi:hypothetical protein